MTTQTVFQNNTKGAIVSHNFASEVQNPTEFNNSALSHPNGGWPALLINTRWRRRFDPTLLHHGTVLFQYFQRPGFGLHNFPLDTNTIGSMEDQGIHGIRWNPWDTMESKESHGLHRTPGIPWNIDRKQQKSTVHYGTPRNIMEFMEYHGIQGSHGIHEILWGPWNAIGSLEYHGIQGKPCMYSIEHQGIHGISWNAWCTMEYTLEAMETHGHP